MATTLYDATAALFAQTLGGLEGVLKIGRKHCEANGIDLTEVLDSRIYENMLPLRYQVQAAIGHSVDDLIEQIKNILEEAPPEILADVMQRGIHLAGGGALIRGLPEFLINALGVPVIVAPDPLTAVVRGTAIILEDMDSFREVLKQNDEELVPTE